MESYMKKDDETRNILQKKIVTSLPPSYIFSFYKKFEKVKTSINKFVFICCLTLLQKKKKL